MIESHLTDEECVEAVRDALDMLPPDLARELEGVAVLVEDRNPEEPELMGIYDPTGGLQRIVIFRELNPSREEVIKTVLHEVGHYFGADEQKVRSWGL
jgi:predicted Zn-dependent protease with MMP-like domain